MVVLVVWRFLMSEVPLYLDGQILNSAFSSFLQPQQVLVKGLGFGVLGLGLRVQGFGFWV